MHLVEVPVQVLQNRSAEIIEWFEETAPKQDVTSGELEVPGHGSYVYHLCNHVCLVLCVKERYEHEVYLLFGDLRDAVAFRLLFGA